VVVLDGAVAVFDSVNGRNGPQVVINPQSLEQHLKTHFFLLSWRSRRLHVEVERFSALDGAVAVFGLL
jgi:hypothetical protein